MGGTPDQTRDQAPDQAAAGTDGRSALRQRRRQAILSATRELARTSGPGGFTVEEVAAAAGVSRRTVFNHFTTFESLLVAVCDDVLATVSDRVLRDVDAHLLQLPTATADTAEALDALCSAVRAADLPTAMTTIVSIIEDGGDRPRAQATSQAALDHVGHRLVSRVRERVPAADVTTVELTVAFLMNGVGVVARHWIDRHGARVSPDSRRAWDDAMARLTAQLADGYRGAGAAHPSG